MKAVLGLSTRLMTASSSATWPLKCRIENVPAKQRMPRLTSTEARVLSSLDHPHIVPVFDVGRTEEGLCFVVTKFIEGSDLAKKSRTLVLLFLTRQRW